MKKTLLQCDQDYVTLLQKLFHDKSTELVERTAGIEFAYQSGLFPSDVDCPSDEDDGTVNDKVWRKVDGGDFPDTYPALAVYVVEKDRDRFGSFEVRLIDFAYLTDFSS